jgi:hypothetical protein
MTQDQLLKLIQQSRTMLESATPEQKIRLLKLIKEGYKSLKQTVVESSDPIEINNDYLDEN